MIRHHVASRLVYVKQSDCSGHPFGPRGQGTSDRYPLVRVENLYCGTSSILRLTGIDTAASPNALITDDHFPAGPPATIM